MSSIIGSAADLQATPSVNSFALRNSAPRAAVIGTSITETRAYLQSNSVTNLGGGRWLIGFASTPRNMVGEGDVVQITQGPAGINTRRATVEAVNINSAFNIVVLVDQSFSIPLTGALPFVYYASQPTFGGYALLAQAMSLCQFDITVDAALGGGDTQQLLRTMGRDLISRADEYDFVIAEIGAMNGIYARDNSTDVEWALTAEYLTNIAKLGKPFCVLGCLPRSASGAWSAAKLLRVLEINRRTRDLVTRYGGTYIDPYGADLGTLSYLDPADATNATPRVADATTDGVHPNSGGGAMLGAQVAAWADLIYPPRSRLVGSIRDNTFGLLNTNPFLNGTGGSISGGSGATISGQSADGCDVAVEAGAADLTIVCSVIAADKSLHGHSIGRVQRMVITTGATASSIVAFRFAQSLQAQTTNGDLLQGGADVTVTNGGTPGSGQPVRLGSYGVSVLAQTLLTTNRFINSTGIGTADCSQQRTRQQLLTPNLPIRTPASIHGTPSNVRAQVSIYLRSNSSVCVDVSRVGIWKNRVT